MCSECAMDAMDTHTGVLFGIINCIIYTGDNDFLSVACVMSSVLVSVTTDILRRNQHGAIQPSKAARMNVTPKERGHRLTSCFREDAGTRTASDRTRYTPETTWPSRSWGTVLLSAMDFITSLQSFPSSPLTTAGHTGSPQSHVNYPDRGVNASRRRCPNA